MDFGYLTLQTHSEHPGLILMTASVDKPALPNGEERHCNGATVRYVASFDDIHAAEMRVRMAMKRQELDTGLFRSNLPHVVAIAETLGLSFIRSYLDPDVSAEKAQQLCNEIDQLNERRQRIERRWDIIGWCGISLLAFNILF